MLIALALASLGFLPEGPVPDLATLTTILDRLHGDVKDFEYSYTVTYINVADRKAGRPPISTTRGRFAMRADNAFHIEADTVSGDRDRSPEPEHESTRSHDPRTSIEGRASGVAKFQLSAKLLNLVRDRGGIRVLNNREYECLGWEEVDGHRCLKVRFASKARFRDQPAEQQVYWIDLDRGGVPLRYDLIRKGKLWARTEGVELARFPAAEGREAWLPIRGIHRTYIDDLRFAPDGSLETTEEPVLEQEFSVILGTVFLNQDLPDRRFGIVPQARPKAEPPPAPR